MLGTAALPESSPPAPTPADPLPDDGDVEIAAPAPGERRVFRYWEYKSRYLATKPDGWEPPEVNSIGGGRGIRLGISLDDVAGKIHRTNGMIDSSRWEHDNRANLAKILSCRIDPPTSLVYGGWHGKGRKKETEPRNTSVRALNR